MKHELSILYDEETGELNLKLDGSPKAIAGILAECASEKDSPAKAFLAALFRDQPGKQADIERLFRIAHAGKNLGAWGRAPLTRGRGVESRIFVLFQGVTIDQRGRVGNKFKKR